MTEKKDLRVQISVGDNLRTSVHHIKLSLHKNEHVWGKSEIIRFHGNLGEVGIEGPMEFGICEYRKRPYSFNQMEHHVLTQELLFAIDDDFIMPVAADGEDGKYPDMESLTAILVRKGEGLIFGKGIWHWVPFPKKNKSFALVGFRKGTAAEDLVIVPLGMDVKMVRT